MVYYDCSIADASDPDTTRKSTLKKEDLVNAFKNFDWDTFLIQAEKAMQRDKYFYPPVEFENNTSRHSLAFFPVGKPGDYEFLLFYKRPKTIKKWLGLIQKHDENYTTQLTKTQDAIAALQYLQALIESNTDFLEKKFR